MLLISGILQPSSALAASITMLDWKENFKHIPGGPLGRIWGHLALRSNGCFYICILYRPLWALNFSSLIYRVCLPSAATSNLVPYFLDQVRLLLSPSLIGIPVRRPLFLLKGPDISRQTFSTCPNPAGWSVPGISPPQVYQRAQKPTVSGLNCLLRVSSTRSLISPVSP